MKKWSQIWLAFTCIALFTSSAASSQEYYYPEECCWKPIRHACFELGADFLYWKPCVSDLEFCGERSKEVLEYGTDYEYCAEGICPCWEPGVRVFFDYPDLFCWCDIGLRLSWTFIEIGTDSNCGPGYFASPLLHPGLTYETFTNVSVKGEYEACYNEWDALLYFDCSCNKCTYISPYIGVAGLILEQDFDVHMAFDDGSANVKWDSKYCGVGLRAGLDYVYDHSPCLSFFGFANGSVIVGEHEAENRQDVWGKVEADLKLKDSKCCLCVPGYHIGVGARGNFCICGWDFAIRGGYEFLQWHNLPKQKTFFGNNLTDEIGRSTSGSRTFGFHGPFLGMILYF